MKKILVLVFCMSLLLAGCGQWNVVRYDTNPAQNVNSAVSQPVNANLNAPAEYVPQDYGMYQGKEYAVNAKHTLIPDINITLNKIIVVDKNFGTTFILQKGTKPEADEKEFVIADYTITAKADTNLKKFIAYVMYTNGLYSTSISYEEAPKFGFYPTDTDFPMKKGETKNVKIVYRITQGMLNYDSIQLYFIDDSTSVDYDLAYDSAAKFQIAKYLK